jgi:hypothetical protein
VYVYAASVYVPYVTANMRTPAQAVASPSTIHLDGTYVVPATLDIDGLTLRLILDDLRHSLQHISIPQRPREKIVSAMQDHAAN